MEHADGTHGWSRRWVLVVALVGVLALAGGVVALARNGWFAGMTPAFPTTSPTGSASPTPTPTPGPTATPTPTPVPTAGGVDYASAPSLAWALADAGGPARPDPFGTPYASDVVVVTLLSEGVGHLGGRDARTGALAWENPTPPVDWRGCTVLQDGTRTACARPLEDEHWAITVVETASGEEVRTVDVDYWPITVAGWEGDVVVAGYRCLDVTCWLVMSRHPVSGSSPVWAVEATTRAVQYPSYLFGESLVADGGLLGFAMNGGLLVVDAATGEVRADVDFDYSGRLWPGGYTVTVSRTPAPVTTVTDLSGKVVLTAPGRSWEAWDADGATSEVVGIGKTAYSLPDGAPLWRLQGDLSGPGIAGPRPEPTEDVDVVHGVAVHLVTSDRATAEATGYDVTTGERLWSETLAMPVAWAPMGPYALATNGCSGTATGLDVTTGEVFWELAPVPGETVTECVDRYRDGYLLTRDVYLDDQDLLRAYAFPTP